MSAEGQAFVEKFSPYTGNAYMIHLRMGMLANETHGYRLYSGDKYFAQLCRCDVKSVQRARATMIKDGYLIQLFEAKGRQVAEYQFIFLGHESEYGQEIGGHLIPDERMGGHPSANSKTSEDSTLSIQIKENQSSASTTSFDAKFEEIWKAYPRHDGKQAAKRVVVALLKAKTPFADLLSAAANYARTRAGDDVKFTKLASTFYGRDKWWQDFIGATRAGTSPPLADDWIEKREREHAESKPMPSSFKDLKKRMVGG
jgi:hypothetical protein